MRLFRSSLPVAVLVCAALAAGCGETPPYCQPAGTFCDGACVDTDVDPRHCGGCDRACEVGAVCTAGVCGVVCPPGLQDCDGSCRDLKVDRANCGGCRNSCAPGEVCADGVCERSCEAGLTACDGSCRDLATDRAHCGDCETVCADGEVCDEGTCALSCQAGFLDCDGACRNPDTDRLACGRCDRACPDGEVCVDGLCRPTCPMGQDLCGGVCKDILSDRAHCGFCGHACGPGLVCESGACGLACRTGETACGGTCVNTATDRAHCGGCGNACPAGQVCSASACAPTCDDALEVCGDSCVDTAHDPDNCGSCGRTCTTPANAEAACFDGLCGMGRCKVSYRDCDGNSVNGCEVSTATDAANCGSCGYACPRPSNAVPVCTSGLCKYSCSTNYSDCDGEAGTGCEIAIGTDPNNCGACGFVCPARPNANTACANRVCTLGACATGWSNCDGITSNGCEIRTSLDLNNCGTCGNVCPTRSNAARTCSGGTCGFNCNTGWGNCDGVATNGCETYLATNRLNCGSCGTVCPTTQSCIGGICR